MRITIIPSKKLTIQEDVCFAKVPTVARFQVLGLAAKTIATAGRDFVESFKGEMHPTILPSTLPDFPFQKSDASWQRPFRFQQRTKRALGVDTKNF